MIHAGFANLLRKGQAAPLQVMVDGTNSNTALIALGYINTIAAQFSQDYTHRSGAADPGHSGAERQVQVTLEQRPWYNPDLNGRWFFVPGVIATHHAGDGGQSHRLCGRARARGRHARTDHGDARYGRPNSSSARRVPFFVVGLGLAGLVTMVGIVWFQIPFVGNPLVLLLGTTLYLLSMLALGLLISTVCSTQQQAFATNFFVVNPLFTLSGFSFPISSMPEFLQWLTYVNPLRYYLIVIRGTFLKGIGLSILWPQMLAMAAIAAVLMTFCILRFRKSLE